tara:strand:+ start:13512 stop:13931 length:420 start_codon:yes stop_codon:yes gene_type:complete
MDTFGEIIDNMKFLENWEDKYRYIIELGQSLDVMPEERKNKETKVNGCMSQVWLHSVIENNGSDKKIIYFIGDSDAFIVKGLIAILISIYSKKSPKEILEINHEDIFQNFGLEEHLSPQRSNGLISMINRIKSDAKKNL